MKLYNSEAVCEFGEFGAEQLCASRPALDLSVSLTSQYTQM